MKRRILVPILMIATALCFYAVMPPTDRLSDEQIAALRVQYPICADVTKVSQLIEIDPSYSLQKVRASYETFVYGEIVGGIQGYSPDSHGYPLSVISDTEGIFKEGEQIKLEANDAFIDYNPKLKEGMKIVLPVHRNNKGRASFNATGFYYITEDGYAIAAYPEKEVTLSGLMVKDLMKNLKK